jgi:hypothetical protein
VSRVVYTQTQYHKKSREDHVISRAADLMDGVLKAAHRNNPLPIGEERIDPRTARKRLALVPGDQLYEHLARHG